MTISHQHERPTVLYFHPGLPCHTCGRETHVGVINGGLVGIDAACYEHGLIDLTTRDAVPSNYALVEQHASVERFVVGMHDGRGYASVLASISPEDAPGFHVWQPADFEELDYYESWRECDYPLAWPVSYHQAPTTEQSETTQYFIVVWEPQYTQFHLCSHDGTIRPAQAETMY